MTPVFKYYLGGATVQPQFIHDCSHCLYVGSDKKFDAYFCWRSDANTGSIILRYGNKAHEYYSTPVQVAIRYDRRLMMPETETSYRIASQLLLDGFMRITCDKDALQLAVNEMNSFYVDDDHGHDADEAAALRLPGPVR